MQRTCSVLASREENKELFGSAYSVENARKTSCLVVPYPWDTECFSMVHLWFRGKRNVREKKSHLKMKPKSFSALEEIF